MAYNRAGRVQTPRSGIAVSRAGAEIMRALARLRCGLVPLFLLLSGAACADRSLDGEIMKVFERHSYREYAPQKIKELLSSKDAPGLKFLDKHAEVVTVGRKLKPFPAGEALSSGLLAVELGDSVYLAKVFRKSPAALAGLRDGDRMLEINGIKADTPAVLEQLRGGAGFKLKVERRTSKGPAAVTAEVKREHFLFPMVFGLYEPRGKTAFVRIGMFYQGSGAAVLSGLEALTRRGAKKVIFDLRDSVGGAPDEAAGVLAAFAPKAGPVLEISSRHKGYTRVFEAPGRGRFAGLKAAVLVNSGTAMASEVFAAALKELGVATVIGGPTKGNVSLTKTFRLGSGKKGLTLTIASMLPPSGKDLEEKGLEPDFNPGLSRGQEEELKAAWFAAGETVLLTDPAYKKALGD